MVCLAHTHTQLSADAFSFWLAIKPYATVAKTKTSRLTWNRKIPSRLKLIVVVQARALVYCSRQKNTAEWRWRRNEERNEKSMPKKETSPSPCFVCFFFLGGKFDDVICGACYNKLDDWSRRDKVRDLTAILPINSCFNSITSLSSRFMFMFFAISDVSQLKQQLSIKFVDWNVLLPN